MNWLTKKKSFYYSLSYFLVCVLASYINSTTYVRTVRKLSEFAFWMAVPALVFSLITIFVREDVAIAWRKFSNYFLLASVIIILLTPNSAPGNDILPIIKENVTIVLSTIYSAISLLLILYKSLKKS